MVYNGIAYKNSEKEIDFMKKLSVKKDSECMACLQCVQACSEAFYKENDVTKSCIQIVSARALPSPRSAPSAVCAPRHAPTVPSPRTPRPAFT